MDTILNVISRFNLDSLSYVNPGCSSKIGLTYYYANLHEVSPKRYIVGGYYDVVYNSSCNTDMQYIEAVIDQNQTVIKTNVFGKQNGTDEIFGYSSGDMKYGYVYNTGMSGYNNTNPAPPQNNATEIMVSKTDTLGNLKWINYYNTPNYYYYPMGIYGTRDSGAVICGMRYNLAAPTITNSCEGFVMKVDVGGVQQYLGIMDYKGFNIGEISSYPNPAHNEIYFNLVKQKNAQIIICDITGKQLMFIQDYKYNDAINISKLQAGIYFYKVLGEESNSRGKFIKQ